MKRRSSRKRSSGQNWGTIGAILVIAAVIFYGGTQGWFKSLASVTNIFNVPNPGEFTEYGSYSVLLNLNPTSLCVGDNCTGTITSNIYGGGCIIFMRNPPSAWQIYKTINLNAAGGYSESNRIDNAGVLEATAICCDAQRNCRSSNTVSLTAIFCSNPTPVVSPTPNPAYTCGQGSDQYMCAGTCPYTHPACVPVDFESLGYTACACVNEATQEIHSDWKPDGASHNPQSTTTPTPTPLSCVDFDALNPFLKSYVQWNGVQWWDSCTNWAEETNEYVCEGGVAVKKEILCPNQDCVDGRCTTGTMTVYQGCIGSGYSRGGCSVASMAAPSGCVKMPPLNSLCGGLFPLNDAFCCS